MINVNKLVNLLVVSQYELIEKYEIKRMEGAVLIRANKKGLRPLLTAHLDTINTLSGIDDLVTLNDFEIRKDLIKLKNKDLSCLGGDDRCGIYIIDELLPLDMYDILITTDEESGGIGVRKWLNYNNVEDYMNEWSCIISLDRRATNGQLEFATYGFDNNKLFNFIGSKGYLWTYGSYTDGVDIARQTGLAMLNLSVGFENEHTPEEIIHLDVLANTLALLKDKEVYEFLCSQQFFAEGFEEETWDSIWEDEGDFLKNLEPVCCDFCGEHKEVYETLNGEFICKDCYLKYF